MKSNIIISLFTGLLLFFLYLPGYAADQTQLPKIKPPAGRDAPIWDKGAEKGNNEFPLIKQITPGIYQFGNIMVDKTQGTVRLNGQVNQTEGIVEYLACGPLGKLHESILQLDVVPYHLQIALLLIGLEPGNKPLSIQGARETPKGDPVEIWVTWQNQTKMRVTHRAEDLIFNNSTRNAMVHTHWIFTGSQIINNRFMAQVEQSIAATYHDPFAILDHGLPFGADDTVYHANSAVLPAKGTKITFIIKKIHKEKLPQTP